MLRVRQADVHALVTALKEAGVGCSAQEILQAILIRTIHYIGRFVLERSRL